VHALTLCCAQSVGPIVEEVARALAGLGFETEVVTGSDARSAILDRDRTRDRPTIYVVCVQGALKDTVVGPLRQALATAGGPNEHLFVAVLDLSLPLSMVGQVRRFAEALERMPDEPRPDPLHERRQWREHSGSRVIDENDTSTYRAVKRDQVPKRRSKTAVAPITMPRRAARIEPTRKYRAVTGPLPVLPPEPSAGELSSASQTDRGDLPRTKRRRVKVPGLDGATQADAAQTSAKVQTRTVVAEAVPERAAANFGAAIAETPRRSRGGIAALTVLLLAGAGYASYRLGAYDRFLPDAGRTASAGAVATATDTPPETKPADPAADPAPKAAAPPQEADPAPAQVPEPLPADADAEAPLPADADAEAPSPADADAEAPSPADADAPEDAPDPEPQPEPEPADSAPDEAQPDPEPADSVPDEPEPEPEPAAPVTDIDQALAAAIERRQVKVSNKYYVATAGVGSARWEGARRVCRELDTDGVDTWRLPHRRELQLLGAIGMLTKGSFWSRTVDGEDTDFAFVYERGNRSLASWEKTELAQVVCVIKRD
jgi:hypothetical protein